MKYRADIDGLRALAVLPVIFFHAGFTFVSGGFIGVDIFFVISGFLITTIIVGEIDKNRFSIVTFYERRARRILPALTFILLFTLPISWVLLLPRDLVDYAQSLLGVVSFSSNFLFWRETGYFEPNAELKPLLHTWSLAVEEQFYLFFPLLMMFIWNKTKTLAISVLVACFFVSFAIAVYWINKNPSAAYFLLPARGWELLIGVFCAIFFNKIPDFKGRQFVPNIFVIVGIGAIIFSIFTFDETTPHPSYFALIPTLGAASIILFGHQSQFSQSVLGSKLMVGVGLISYSLYLWHQPIIAFVRYKWGMEIDSDIGLIIVSSSILFAYLTWRYVEAPFRASPKRDPKAFSKTSIFVYSAFTIAFFAGIGVLGIVGKGFDSRLSEDQNYYTGFSNYAETIKLRDEEHCFLGPTETANDYSPNCITSTEIVIIGDSHAKAIKRGLGDITGFFASACPPLFGEDFINRPNCNSVNSYNFETISNLQPKMVILHAYWKHYEKEKMLSGLNNSIQKIKDVSPSTKIIVIGGVPNWDERGLPYQLIKALGSNRKTDLVQRQHTVIDDVLSSDKEIEATISKNFVDVKFVSVLEKLCDERGCIALIGEEKVPISWDNAHLTIEGAKFVVERIKADFN